jgi:hypothetical protein
MRLDKGMQLGGVAENPRASLVSMLACRQCQTNILDCTGQTKRLSSIHDARYDRRERLLVMIEF